MSDTRNYKIEDILLRLTEDVATVKAKLDIIDDIKDALDDVNRVQAEIELLRLTVTTLENRVNRLEDKIAEEVKYKSRSMNKAIITIIVTIVSTLLLEQMIK